MTLPIRALAIGAVLSIAVAMYSAFAGLKFGGVYWPSVTMAVVAIAILKVLGNSSKNEANIIQTAASAGGLLAAGVIFTVPAIWLLGLEVGFLEIIFVSLVGGLAGILFSIPLRKEMIEREKLPYPDGVATAAIIEAGDEKGEKAKLVFGMVGVGAVFSLLRDQFGVIPGLLSIDSLKAPFTKLFSLGSSVSLIPFAGGYLIGAKFTAIWFAGAVLSNLILIPYIVSTGLFETKFAAASEVAAPLGIGIVVGASIAYFALKALPRLRQIASSYKETGFGSTRLFGLAIILLVAVLTIVLQLNVVISIIAILGAFAMAYIGARVTGEMNVDPMELFAIIVLIAAKLLFGFNAVLLVLLAAVVCISAGVAGDLMQDLKAGFILGTDPKKQLIAQVVGVVAASLAIGFVMLAFSSNGLIGTPEFPAPQATALSAVVSAGALDTVLLAGILIGLVAALALSFFSSAIAVVAFGIGVYVPIALSLPLFIGGLIRFAADRKGFTEKGRLLAAGAIAGEGFIGMVLLLIGLAQTFF